MQKRDVFHIDNAACMHEKARLVITFHQSAKQVKVRHEQPKPSDSDAYFSSIILRDVKLSSVNELYRQPIFS